MEIGIYRIVQELVNNAIRHSKASDIYIQLVHDDTSLHITVEDNGCGFNREIAESQQGIGLRNVSSRVEYLDGTLEIQTEKTWAQPLRSILILRHDQNIHRGRPSFGERRIKEYSHERAGHRRAWSAVTGKEALLFLEKNMPDIAFLDINLPDISGIELCKKIRQEYPAIKCIALSTFSESSYISRMIENGASGYLLKNSSKDEILDAIRQVKQGGMYLNVHMDTQHKSKTNIPFITRREKEVLLNIADGLTNQQIADKLFVSVTTINSHRKNLLTKFEVNNTAALIKLAIQHQLI